MAKIRRSGRPLEAARTPPLEPDPRLVLRALRDQLRGATGIRLPLEWTGVYGEIAAAFNERAELDERMALELQRLARAIADQGLTSERMDARRAGGPWRAVSAAVDTLIDSLLEPSAEVGRVIGAVARGDLSQTMPVAVRGRRSRGEYRRLAETVNTMVGRLNSFASEVIRVAREVGIEGKLGGQARVKGVAGTWKDLTDNVNQMASNLTNQVRNIAQVTTAVAQGDLTRKITVDARGEILELKSTINTMVDQLSSFSSEVTRVAREVGTDGKLGGQANVQGVAGTWKDLTENVNLMASNLTDQVRNLAQVTTAVARGDLTRKITVDARGEILELKETINTMVDQLSSFASEVTRVAREVGTQGRLGGQATVPGVAGAWKDLTDNVNQMASNLTDQVRNIAEVSTAIANGDLSKKITVDVRGEIAQLKETINSMVDQLRSFASEVIRVAREVGTEGILGGQALVQGVGGIWKDLTENVNHMATNLTNQVRGIATVVRSVAQGDLKRKLTLEVKGEIADLAETINGMIDTLGTFAAEVSGVAREVGVEGKLGGQAEVPGAAGLWRDLTDNVNELAARLTTQVRAIFEVATAVTAGNLTRSITVEARGEVEALKNNINQMIQNLRETTRINREQDWLKTNLANFARMFQGQRDSRTLGRLLLSELARVLDCRYGVFYLAEGEPAPDRPLHPVAAYAHGEQRWEDLPVVHPGQGLVGQCALGRDRILLAGIPPGYVRIRSGLGEASPTHLVIVPVLFEGGVLAVLELASFEPFGDAKLALLDQLADSLGTVLNTIAAAMRTTELLARSQKLTETLQRQQDELQNTNAELAQQARLLTEQKGEVEQKNREVEVAKQALEEKAHQLALTSKYKTEFLANMSHELRTPLNSLLILARMLADNQDGNLSHQQVQYASTIHSAGANLLGLINDILDLSKIEAGVMAVDITEVVLEDVAGELERTFRQLAVQKGLDLQIRVATGDLATVKTDRKRLIQILTNLLGNAFKFTHEGRVSLDLRIATSGWEAGHGSLDGAETVVAFAVEDTGIGIPLEKQRLIFDAFRQADGGTSRKYGGTGLGLSISRELAHLLGGVITVESAPGKGSAFTLFLPRAHAQATAAAEVAGAVARDAVAAPPPVPEPTSLDPGPLPLVRIPGPLEDDRAEVDAEDRVLLVIEDDPVFARILLELGRQRGFKVLVAGTGEEAMLLARRFVPDAISLDLGLPGISGWSVLERLKADPTTRTIPVQVISGGAHRDRALALSAFEFMQKPVAEEQIAGLLDGMMRLASGATRRTLIVEPEPYRSKCLTDLVATLDTEVVIAQSAAVALQALRAGPFANLIVDYVLPDMPCIAFLRKAAESLAPGGTKIIVYSGGPIPEEQAGELRQAAEGVIILHRLDDTPDVRSAARRRRFNGRPHGLGGRRILVVDDDPNNQFALRSLLEGLGTRVTVAENGHQAIRALEADSAIDLVLMDVMMPEMDGYEAMERIRGRDSWRTIPIIALTAKAMKGDRERCLRAGASDYVSKPFDRDHLVGLLEFWLERATTRGGAATDSAPPRGGADRQSRSIR